MTVMSSKEFKLSASRGFASPSYKWKHPGTGRGPGVQFGTFALPRARKLPVPQTAWTLNCQNCNRVFAHCEVDIRSRTRPYDELWPYRPQVPEGDLKAICPHCQQPGSTKNFNGRFIRLILSTSADYLRHFLKANWDKSARF
jgi:hypothetical protein